MSLHTSREWGCSLGCPARQSEVTRPRFRCSRDARRGLVSTRSDTPSCVEKGDKRGEERERKKERERKRNRGLGGGFLTMTRI